MRYSGLDSRARNVGVIAIPPLQAGRVNISHPSWKSLTNGAHKTVDRSPDRAVAHEL